MHITDPTTVAAAPEDSGLARLSAQALSAQGALATAQQGFVAREGQQNFARYIANAVTSDQVLVAEAGTGTGKTFAYLVPALLAAKKVLISTGTKTLQDQLFERDLPAVQAALGVGLKTALLKGRSNYVCRYHLQRNLAEGRFERRSDIAILHRIDRFATLSVTGDRAQAPGIAEDAPAWAFASSTRDNCLGQDCKFFDDCFVFKARRKAMQADLVVINHHLFCADLALRDEGVSELLPSAQVLIFDEAHQLPDVATNFFGDVISTRQVVGFGRDMMKAGHTDAPDGADWIALNTDLEQSLREFRLAAGRPRRLDEQQLRSDAEADLVRSFDALRLALNDPIDALVENAERSRDLDKLRERGQALQRAMTKWLLQLAPELVTDHVIKTAGSVVLETSADGDSDSDSDSDSGSDSGTSESDAGSDGSDDNNGDKDLSSDSAVDDTPQEIPAIRWAEVQRNGVSFHLTPLSVAEPFRRQIKSRPQAWIFTSATLSVGQDFSHFVRAMGLDDAKTVRYDSPFDFAKQALLYVPEGIGEPRSPSYAQNLVNATLPLLRENAGRAFFLCTSLRMVDEVARQLREHMADDDEPCQIIEQGSGPRAQLLTQFRSESRPILVGSASFWEGVDVVGQQLSMVVIDKLPFAPPDDPILKARSDALRKDGIDPFMAMHWPHAALALKQGAGRLIRSETDRGLLIVGDPRLAEKAYGRRMLRGLPPFTRTRDAGRALEFVGTDAVTPE